MKVNSERSRTIGLVGDVTAPGGEAAPARAGSPAGANGPAAAENARAGGNRPAAAAPAAARLAMTEGDAMADGPATADGDAMADGPATADGDAMADGPATADGDAMADGPAAENAAATQPPAAARGPATADRPGGGNGSAGAGGAGEDGSIGTGGEGAGTERNGTEVSRFVERFAAMLTEAGIPRMPARVFAALLATDSGRLTAAELAAQLQASPAAVSGGVRYLMGVGMVHREGEPGSRRHHYRVPDHVWDEVVSSRDRMMARWTAVMREGVALLGADTQAGARLAESAEYFEFVSAEIPRVVARWREHKAARDAGAPDH